jgi:hypothetical protein
MTVDFTCPTKATKKELWLAASAVEVSTGVRRRDHQEPRNTPVQRVGHATVDASADTSEDTSLATLRWCRSRDCRRRATPGAPTVIARVVILAFPLALTHAFAAVVGVGAGGEGAAGGHGGSYCCGRRGSCCCRGHPPPEGAE